MHLPQIRKRLDSLANQGISYRLAPGATSEAIKEAEFRLGIRFPGQVTAFWMAFDGLEVDAPPFKILSLSQLQREGDLIVFCICDREIRIAFNVQASNQAGQWSIVTAETGYCITLTMASFWSVHMWSWIVKHRPIWHGAPA